MSKVRTLSGGDRGVFGTASTCRKKIGYRSASLASLECQRLQRENPNDHYSVYRCQECLDWHVGHSVGQFGRSKVNTDAPPEEPGEYELLVQNQHRIQAVLGELRESRPENWQGKRRYLMGELAATVQRMQEIKAHRRRIADDRHDGDQWTAEQKAAYWLQRAREQTE